MFRTSAPKNKFHQALNNTSREAANPVDEQDRISWGIITEVKPENSQVKVRLFSRDGELEPEILDGAFLPIINSLEHVHMLYGQLRKGLYVRVYWRGKLTPRQCIVEVVGDEDTNLFKKDPQVNDAETRPYKLFSGGYTL